MASSANPFLAPAVPQTDDTTTYAPKSPDLNAAIDDFEEESVPHPQHQQYRGSISHISPFTPTEPTRSPWGSVAGQGGIGYSPHQTQAQQYFQPQHPHHFQPPPPHIQQYQQYQSAYQQHSSSPQAGWLNRQATYPLSPGAVPPGMVKHEDEDFSPYAARTRRVKTDSEVKMEQPQSEIASLAAQIEVRTKFPVARIKRIMQADEDVGKVAQVTPVIVSKALELFMISLVTKAATQAKAASSKRVLASHLKAAILQDQQFDFLTDIVQKVPDAPDPNAKKEDPDSDDVEAGPKKKKGGKKRKQSEDF